MILLRVQIILDNFLATISKGQSCGQNVIIVAQRAVALPFIISAKKHSPSENGFQLMAHFQAFFSPWGSSWKRSRPSVFSPRCFILQAFQYTFEFFILGKSSEVMLAANPILGQNMRSSEVILRRLIDWQDFKQRLLDVKVVNTHYKRDRFSVR